jgi:hypothetical protein
MPPKFFIFIHGELEGNIVQTNWEVGKNEKNLHTPPPPPPKHKRKKSKAP